MRELRRTDWSQLLALNESSVRELSALDERRLASILSFARRAIAAELDGQVIAFAVAMAPDTAYDSPNYRWFAERFEHFLYLDRVVVSDEHRRLGIATRLYGAMEHTAVPHERMVCEVNLRPRNGASLAFHQARGYREIARLEHGAEKLVALMSKELTTAPPC